MFRTGAMGRIPTQGGTSISGGREGGLGPGIEFRRKNLGQGSVKFTK